MLRNILLQNGENLRLLVGSKGQWCRLILLDTDFLVPFLLQQLVGVLAIQDLHRAAHLQHLRLFIQPVEVSEVLRYEHRSFSGLDAFRCFQGGQFRERNFWSIKIVLCRQTRVERSWELRGEDRPLGDQCERGWWFIEVALIHLLLFALGLDRNFKCS